MPCLVKWNAKAIRISQIFIIYYYFGGKRVVAARGDDDTGFGQKLASPSRFFIT
jgi:hypothetical protein